MQEKCMISGLLQIKIQIIAVCRFIVVDSQGGVASVSEDGGAGRGTWAEGPGVLPGTVKS